MTQDKQKGRRRANEYRGFVAIALGVFVLILAAYRNDDNSWQGVLLGGVSLAFGTFSLVRAFRD